MREDDLLTRIRRRSEDLTGAFDQIEVGPGDDAAVIRTPSGDRLTITVDHLVAGRHYDESLLDSDEGLDLVARKAVARSVSDIAAMGASPTWALATALLPPSFTQADALFDRCAHWARHWGCPLVGGDIAATAPEKPGPLTLTTTVAGSFRHQPLLRSGARPGDTLWLTGQIGGSYQSGWHLRFEPRLAAGLAAAESEACHAAIDLSDGLGLDAHRLAVASDLVIEIDAAALPISHRCGSWRSAVSEGEDYELLIACAQSTPPFHAEPPLLGPLGTCRARTEGEPPGAFITDAHGSRHQCAAMGWDHGG